MNRDVKREQTSDLNVQNPFPERAGLWKAYVLEVLSVVYLEEQVSIPSALSQ